MSDDLRSHLYARYVTGERARPPTDLAGFASRAPYLRRLVRQHLPESRGAAIFEMGCGYGALLHFAREAGYQNLRGVDLSPQQVEAAHGLGIEGVELRDLLSSLAQLPEASQDVIVALDVLAHFEKHELLELVDAVHRALKPSGRWIIHVPNAESPFFGAVRYGDLTHALAYTRDSLSQLLLASGFGTVECFEDTPDTGGVAGLARRIVWRAIRSGLRPRVAVETGDRGRDAIFSRNLLAVARKA